MAGRVSVGLIIYWSGVVLHHELSYDCHAPAVAASHSQWLEWKGCHIFPVSVSRVSCAVPSGLNTSTTLF